MPIAVPQSPLASTPGRSRTMAGIRRSNTRPELAIRSEVHRRGLRFRKDFRLDLGAVKPRPDLAFTRRRVAVFVDGCFWHCCPVHGKSPSQNTGYWNPKLARNQERDRLQEKALEAAGWTVLRIWEHEETVEAADRVEELLRSR
jgi:DNA mismatch endonuclease, patch repair protein